MTLGGLRDFNTVRAIDVMTMDRHGGSYRDDAFLQSCVLGTGRWSQCEIPKFSVSA